MRMIDIVSNLATASHQTDPSAYVPVTAPANDGDSVEQWTAEFGARCKTAVKVACRTESILANRGWCLWQYAALGGEVIVVAADNDVPGIPRGKVIYTKSELCKLFGGGKPVDLKTLRLIHEAKRLGGARVTSCE